uniref:Uncharacterized protein n=1 Tax=Anguilla anguilla TaxID=7936 RepID=A0A0E9RVK0_ANGAN
MPPGVFTVNEKHAWLLVHPRQARTTVMSLLKLMSSSCLWKFLFAVSSLAVFALFYLRTFNCPLPLQPLQR